MSDEIKRDASGFYDPIEYHERMTRAFEKRNVCPDSGEPCPCLPGSTSEAHCAVARDERLKGDLDLLTRAAGVSLPRDPLDGSNHQQRGVGNYGG